MVLKLSEEEKKRILDIISNYSDVNKEYQLYKNKAIEIQDKLKELDDRLNMLHEEETNIMKELHEKYGDFGLQDISDTIYEQ